MKSYTDLEQSKKLAEILPLESADMWYHSSKDGDEIECGFDATRRLLYVDYGDGLPAWSLAALLELMPKIGGNEPKLCKRYYVDTPLIRYVCTYGLLKETKEYNNPIDACYEMVCWLKENGKI